MFAGAPWRHSKCGGTERRPADGSGNVALLAPVGAQLLNLAVHLVQGPVDSGLQPSPPVVGEIPRERPRVRSAARRAGARPSAVPYPVPVFRSPEDCTWTRAFPNFRFTAF